MPERRARGRAAGRGGRQAAVGALAGRAPTSSTRGSRTRARWPIACTRTAAHGGWSPAERHRRQRPHPGGRSRWPVRAAAAARPAPPLEPPCAPRRPGAGAAPPLAAGAWRCSGTPPWAGRGARPAVLPRRPAPQPDRRATAAARRRQDVSAAPRRAGGHGRAFAATWSRAPGQPAQVHEAAKAPGPGPDLPSRTWPRPCASPRRCWPPTGACRWRADADEAAALAERARPPRPCRTGVLEAARAIAAAANGRLAEAAAAAERALAAGPAGSEARFAAGRLFLPASWAAPGSSSKRRRWRWRPRFGAAAARPRGGADRRGRVGAASAARLGEDRRERGSTTCAPACCSARRRGRRPGRSTRQDRCASAAGTQGTTLPPLRHLRAADAAATARLAGDRGGAVRARPRARSPRRRGSARRARHRPGGAGAGLAGRDRRRRARRSRKIRDHLRASFVPRVWAEAAVALGPRREGQLGRPCPRRPAPERAPRGRPHRLRPGRQGRPGRLRGRLGAGRLE